jgi:hypothetical protein
MRRPCGKFVAERVAPVRGRAEDEVAHQEQADERQHQRGDDLARAEPGAAQRRRQDPQRPGERADPQDDEGGRDAGEVGGERQAGPRGADGTHVELSLGPDVEQLHAERDGRREAREDEGGGGGEAVGEAEPGGEAGLEEVLVHRERPVAAERQEDGAGRQGGEHRQHR